MYKQIGEFQRRGERNKNFVAAIAKNSGLTFELDNEWLQVRKRINRPPWHKALHQRMAILGASNASSRWMGGLAQMSGSDRVFQAAVDFPDNLVVPHINVQEAYVLQQLPTLFCADRPQQAKGTTILVHVDNTVLFTVKRGRATDVLTLEIIFDISWLHVAR